MNPFDFLTAWTALLQVHVQFPEGAMPLVEQVLRWVHFLAGITWIGLLYFFNLVNVPFMKEIDASTKGKVVPKLLPRTLWWFRWGAVVTVLAGLLYFIILLWRDAERTGSTSVAWKWLGLWLVVWVVVWFILYALVCTSPAKATFYTLAVIVVVVAGTWGILALLQNEPEIGADNRALSIAVGGGMGLVMLLNVWGIIWRYQKKIIAWTQANAEQGTPIPPESAKLARIAFLASRTNFWLSWPMLFFMASASHFAFLGR